jgi:hypothetical protein
LDLFGDTVHARGRLVLCLALLAVAGACGGTDPLEVKRVIRWTLGDVRRDPMPATGDALLLLVPTGTPPERGQVVAKACTGANSFLPAPEGSGQFFLACDGRIFVRSSQTLVPVPGQDPDLYIWNLLAFRAAQSPLEMLVSATPAQSEELQLWLLRIENHSLAGATRVRELPELASRQAFFGAFDAPRCLAAAQRCLRVNRAADDSKCYLDLWDWRTDTVTSLQTVSGRVQDAAWASRDGQWLYMLVGQ